MNVEYMVTQDASVPRKEEKMGKSNVISIFSKRSFKEQERPTLPAVDMFNETIRKNAELQEKLRKERLKANQSVLKSYKIKQEGKK